MKTVKHMVAGVQSDPHDTPPEKQQFVLALSILIQRIGELPHRERDALFRLLQEWRKHGNDPDERRRIQSVMEEIMTQAPVSVRSVDIQHQKPLSEERKKLAAFIGRKIKQVREDRKLSQQELAAAAGLRQSHISRLEGGDHTPTRHTLEKIAKALKVDARCFDPMED